MSHQNGVYSLVFLGYSRCFFRALQKVGAGKGSLGLAHFMEGGEEAGWIRPIQMLQRVPNFVLSSSTALWGNFFFYFPLRRLQGWCWSAPSVGTCWPVWLGCASLPSLPKPFLSILQKYLCPLKNKMIYVHYKSNHRLIDQWQDLLIFMSPKKRFMYIINQIVG